ncbi:hypothetical protein D3C85_1549830 [compost metagenome]
MWALLAGKATGNVGDRVYAQASAVCRDLAGDRYVSDVRCADAGHAGAAWPGERQAAVGAVLHRLTKGLAAHGVLRLSFLFCAPRRGAMSVALPTWLQAQQRQGRVDTT